MPDIDCSDCQSSTPYLCIWHSLQQALAATKKPENIDLNDPENRPTMKHRFNKLTPAEEERLAILSEECAEVIQAIGKIFRHGYNSCHPDDNIGLCNNRQSLEREIGDVLHAISMLEDAEDIDPMKIAARITQKRSTIGQYLHCQEER